MVRRWLLLGGLGMLVGPCTGIAGERVARESAEATLRKAVAFFRQQVSVRGGYLWQYSADLTLREGEGKAAETTAWVQPPGTPSVGQAYLDAYRLTGDAYLLEAAREAAEALILGQLRSGGWDYRIEFDPSVRKKVAYRADGDDAKGQNTSTLDDDTTQAALRFMMNVDRELKFQDERLHEAVMFGLDSLLRVQYPNGAWPQRFVEPPDPAKFPVRKAAYPDSWSRTYPKTDYREFYTFNDNTIADTIATMLEAARIYGDGRYQQAAEKAGDFIILAQMPDPQPAWAQQYDANMCPAWARRFEPPAITGGESQGVLRTLMTLYRNTGNRKYLEPIPRAIQYLKVSRLGDGRLARFHELRTNKPLYFTKQYELTYDSSDMPTHYAFIVGSQLDSMEAAYQQLSTS
ncbi:MAG: polysaccharide lyase, partial [Planctomycetes bacterium]|nr:polysaccharide lyase [Planctomycetota bacterium]